MNRLLLLFASSVCLLPAQNPPSSTVFDSDAVHEIHLTFTQPDWYDILTKNYESSADDVPYMSASAVWGSASFASVGVRFKGNSSYSGATTKKKPFHLKLNEYVKGQKVGGVASFSLSNAWNDPSFVREKPYYELATAAGLHAPRSNFAALYINEQYWGLYVMTEIVNGDYLTSRFGKGDDGGNLYKGELGGSLEYLGEDPAAYQSGYSKQSNETANDWTDLIALCRLIAQTDPTDFPAKVEPILDIDSILTALAIDNLTVNLDSYVDMAQNYYIYREPATGKWLWIPWDPSLAFGAFAGGMTVEQMREMALEWTVADNALSGGDGGVGRPGAGGASPSLRPLATKLWQVPAYKQRYRQIYQNLVDTVLIPDALVARMNTLRTMIRPWVLQDTQKLVTMDQFDAAMSTDIANPGPAAGTTSTTTGVPGNGGGMGTVPGLDPFIRGRAVAVKDWLAGQTPLTVTSSASLLLFAQASGGANPVPQNVSLALSDTTKAATFTIAAISSSSAPWLTVSPASGNLPAKLMATVNAAGLAVGTYTGTVAATVSGAANSPVNVAVRLVVTPGASLVASPSSLTFGGTGIGQPGAGGDAASSQTLQVVSTEGATAFTATFSGTNCGSFVTLSPVSGTTAASITATANLPASTAGNCAGTITLSGASVLPATVSVTASRQTAFPGGGVVAPAITAVTNAASYASGALAPGEIVTIFGTGFGFGGGFSGGPGGAPGGPPATGGSTITYGTFDNGKLSTTVNGVQVLFDNVAAPLLYVGQRQLGAIVPFGVSGKAQVAVQVTVAGQAPLGQTSAAVQKSVAIAAPGIFTTTASGAGTAAAVGTGSTIQLFLTGAGVVEPAGSDGLLASTTGSTKIALPVTATIGGLPATVSYAGAVPGAVYGLYQVNLVVPDGVPSGNVPVQVSVGGFASQSGVTLSR